MVWWAVQDLCPGVGREPQKVSLPTAFLLRLPSGGQSDRQAVRGRAPGPFDAGFAARSGMRMPPRAFSAAVAGQGWVNTCPSGTSRPGWLSRHRLTTSGTWVIRVPTNNDKPAPIAAWLPSEIRPASATTVTSDNRWAALEELIIGSMVAVSALLPSNAPTVSGNKDSGETPTNWLPSALLLLHVLAAGVQWQFDDVYCGRAPPSLGWVSRCCAALLSLPLTRVRRRTATGRRAPRERPLLRANHRLAGLRRANHHRARPPRATLCRRLHCRGRITASVRTTGWPSPSASNPTFQSPIWCRYRCRNPSCRRSPSGSRCRWSSLTIGSRAWSACKRLRRPSRAGHNRRSRWSRPP